MRFKLLSLIALGALLLASCSKVEVLPSAIGESTEETYFFQGGNEFSGASAEVLETNMVSEIMEDMVLFTGLYYRVSYNKNGTEIHSGEVWVNGVFEGAFWSGENGGTGNMTVVGDECLLELDITDVPEGFSDVHLSGSFDTEEAQWAVDRLRKTAEDWGEATGTEPFTVHWNMQGKHDGISFGVNFDQAFVAKRIRYSTPI